MSMRWVMVGVGVLALAGCVGAGAPWTAGFSALLLLLSACAKPVSERVAVDSGAIPGDGGPGPIDGGWIPTDGGPCLFCDQGRIVDTVPAGFYCVNFCCNLFF